LHFSKHEQRCELAMQKGMEDMEDHPETLSTQGQHLYKGPIASLARGQVEEKCQPVEKNVRHISG
jgi:hypothetical protein